MKDVFAALLDDGAEAGNASEMKRRHAQFLPLLRASPGLVHALQKVRNYKYCSSLLEKEAVCIARLEVESNGGLHGFVSKLFEGLLSTAMLIGQPWQEAARGRSCRLHVPACTLVCMIIDHCMRSECFVITRRCPQLCS